MQNICLASLASGGYTIFLKDKKIFKKKEKSKIFWAAEALIYISISCFLAPFESFSSLVSPLYWSCVSFPALESIATYTEFNSKTEHSKVKNRHV